MGLKPDNDDAYLDWDTCWSNQSETGKACRDWEKTLSLESPQVEQMICQYCKNYYSYYKRHVWRFRRKVIFLQQEF
jgi:hypothetical protein